MMRESSVESFRLLNPAFIGSAVAQTAIGFEKEAGVGLPFIYAFLAVPLVLHAETRDRLPGSVATRLVSWTERNSDLITLFPRRLADVAPLTRHAIFFATSFAMLRLGPNASLHSTSDKALTAFGRNNISEEVKAIHGKALFVGRWLATSGLPSTILTTLGVRL
jgi:Family of unknown function (DUF6521)